MMSEDVVHRELGGSIWNSSLTTGQKNGLEKLQKLVLKITYYMKLLLLWWIFLHLNKDGQLYSGTTWDVPCSLVSTNISW